jgi:NAD+ kinase
VSEIRRALLFVNSHKAEAPALVAEVSAELNRLGIPADSYPFEGQPPLIAEPPDLAFCLGGDGTVLFAARISAP